jgi:hypothetical protein
MATLSAASAVFIDPRRLTAARAGTTIVQLAGRYDCNVSNLRAILARIYASKPVTPGTLGRLATALGVMPQDLMAEAKTYWDLVLEQQAEIDRAEEDVRRMRDLLELNLSRKRWALARRLAMAVRERIRATGDPIYQNLALADLRKLLLGYRAPDLLEGVLPDG